MKKIIYSLFLATSLLLSGCTGDAPNEPKFKKYSRKVDFETFSEELNERGKDLGISTDELDSYIAMNDVYVTVSKKLKNAERKTDEVVSETSRDVYKFQYDKGDSIFTIDRQKDVTTLQESVGGTQKSDETTDNMSYAVQFEELDVNGTKDLIAYTKSNKAYYDLGPVGDTMNDSVSGIAKYGIIIPLLSYIKASSLYDTMSDEEKTKFNFYSDKNVFTITYVIDETSDIAAQSFDDPSNPDPNIIGHAVTKRDVKIQITIDKGSLVLGYKDKGETISTYTEESGKFHKGEVETQTALESCQASIEKKKVSLKRIKMSSYTKLDSGFSILSLFK